VKCPYCGAVVSEGAERCVQCGSGIVWDGDRAQFDTPGPLERVYTAWDPAALLVIESLLEVNGIPFGVANELTQDYFALGRVGGGYNPATGPPVVLVPAQRADEARELIAAMSEPLAAESPGE